MVDLEKSSHHTFHSFCIKPKIKFETQEKSEEILLILRAHPVTQLPWVINGLILFILLVFLNTFLKPFFIPTQFFYINIFVSIMILSYFYFNVLNYFFNVGIITNKRIVDIDFYAVIYKELTEARLNRVEDITARSGGYFESVFNYGDIFIQTAGTEKNIEFVKVTRPNDAVGIINNLIP